MHRFSVFADGHMKQIPAEYYGVHVVLNGMLQHFLKRYETVYGNCGLSRHNFFSLTRYLPRMASFSLIPRWMSLVTRILIVSAGSIVEFCVASLIFTQRNNQTGQEITRIVCQIRES